MITTEAVNGWVEERKGKWYIWIHQTWWSRSIFAGSAGLACME